jgi:NADPH:quinone reductase-like Zn-dependent oxidoreductase
MRAVAVREFRAEPEVIDVPRPEPGPGELLVRVDTAGLNPFDWQIIDGALAEVFPHTFPLVVGMDFAGHVESAGPGVSRFSAGDAVFGQVKVVAGGSYAEYAIVAETGAVAAVPEGLSLRAAAALPTAGSTALGILQAARVRAGESLLVVGAAGGVGSYLTQLAAANDVRVLAAVRGNEQQRMGSLGAAVVIDSTVDKVAERVREEYPDGVDALVDLVSDDSAFAHNAALVHNGGVALTSRQVADTEALKSAGVEGINYENGITTAQLAQLAAEVADGRLKVAVDAEVPLAEAPAAVRKSRSGGARGKTVIVI